MPQNFKNSELKKSIFEAVVNGNDNVEQVWLAIEGRASRATVKRYLDDLVKLGALSVNREYLAHRYVAAGNISDIVPELEYYLPKIDEYRAQKVPQLVNHFISEMQAGKDINNTEVNQDGRHYVLFALATRSEDPSQLPLLCKEIVRRLNAAFMEYRLFDTIAKRGIDKSRDAKNLFELGDTNPHEAALLFNQLFAECFGPSPQTNA